MGKLRVLSLFAGIGGFDLGLERTGGFATVAFCEIDPAARAVLNKNWPGVPCYNDVGQLTAEQLRADGIDPDAIVAGFPCQDASVGQTQWGARVGIEGERTGLWRHVKRLAAELRPRFLLLENVPGLLSAGFGRVLGDLAEIGFDAEWHCIPARALGLPHRRDRLWVIAYPCGSGLPGHIEGSRLFEPTEEALAFVGDDAAGAWRTLDGTITGLRDCHGFPVKVDRARVKQLGNAVVPQIPELIGRAILQTMEAAA